MEIVKKVVNDVTILSPQGDVDVYNSNEIKDEVGRLVDSGCNRILVDMSGVSYIDSSGLGVLVSALNVVRKVGGQFKICHLRSSVEKVFQITKLNTFFDVYRDREEALASF